MNQYKLDCRTTVWFFCSLVPHVLHISNDIFEISMTQYVGMGGKLSNWDELCNKLFYPNFSRKRMCWKANVNISINGLANCPWGRDHCKFFTLLARSHILFELFSRMNLNLNSWILPMIIDHFLAKISTSKIVKSTMFLPTYLIYNFSGFVLKTRTPFQLILLFFFESYITNSNPSEK